MVQINFFNRTHKKKIKTNTKNTNSRSINEEDLESDSLNISQHLDNQYILKVITKSKEKKSFQRKERLSSKKS